ncbi:MAG: beta-ketoacyl-ACP synthase II [Paludibacteraceae bacterium]
MKRVVITGLGAISPIGNNAAETWAAAIAGKCGIEPIRGFEDEVLPIHVAGQVKNFDPIAAGLTAQEIRHYDLFCQFAVAASLEAVQQSGLVSGENIAPERLGVYLGSGIGGLQTFVAQTKNYLDRGAKGVSPLFIPMLIANMGGGNTAIRLNAQGPNLTSVAACATSTNTIGEAFLAIQAGRADAIVAGGAEAAIHPLAIGGFANARALSTVEDPAMACLPFDSRRKGFVMAEGAGVMVLEEMEHAIARGAHIIAEVCGYGHTCDAHHYTAPRPDGTVTARCIREALDQAGYQDGETLYINAHGTGTAMNDSAETKAIKLALGEEEARRALISSTKSMTGHMLGAAGGLELVLTALAVENGIVPPTIGLTEQDPVCDLYYTPLHAEEHKIDIAISNSLGFGGHNATVAIRPIR